MAETRAAPVPLRGSARVCYLHVGMHKTGTTSLQLALHGWDDGRARYARFDDANHSVALYTLFAPKAAMHPALRREGHGPKGVQALRRLWRAQLDADLAWESRDLILSGEALSRPMAQDPVAENLLARLLDSFDRVEVLAYVRAPGGFILSQYQELLKQGAKLPELPQSWPRYRARLEKWLTPRDRVVATAVPFDRAHLASGCVVKDAMRRFGLNGADMIVQDRNLSLSAEAAAALMCHRKFGTGLPDRPGKAAAQAHTRGMLACIGNRRLELSRRSTELLCDTWAEDLDWMTTALRLDPAAAAGFRSGEAPRPRDGAFVLSEPDDLIALAPEIESDLRALVPGHVPHGEDAAARVASCVDAMLRREWRRHSRRTAI